MHDPDQDAAKHFMTKGSVLKTQDVREEESPTYTQACSEYWKNSWKPRQIKWLNETMPYQYQRPVNDH